MSRHIEKPSIRVSRAYRLSGESYAVERAARYLKGRGHGRLLKFNARERYLTQTGLGYTFSGSVLVVLVASPQTHAEAQEEVYRFWTRFPVARAYQREEIARIQRAADSGETVTVEHDGRTVARYTKGVRWYFDNHGRRRSSSVVVGVFSAVLRAVEAGLLDLMVGAW